MISLIKKLQRRNRAHASLGNNASSSQLDQLMTSIESAQMQQELARLETSPRYEKQVTDLLGPTIEFVDGKSFYFSFLEIFQDRIYEFLSAPGHTPYIIDGGSNIGLSIIWFKLRYPDSEVVGFEADPVVYETLNRNISSMGLDSVEVINRAIWNCETQLAFEVEGADGGRLHDVEDEKAHCKRTVQIETTRLTPWLQRPVDFLKLDIEGAEFQVLQDCANDLENVQNIFVEYHSFANSGQTLDQILKILIDAGFRIQIHNQFSSPQPLMKQPTQLGMDLQLNIFGYRD